VSKFNNRHIIVGKMNAERCNRILPRGLTREQAKGLKKNECRALKACFTSGNSLRTGILSLVKGQQSGVTAFYIVSKFNNRHIVVDKRTAER